MDKLNRRDFVRQAGTAAVGLGLSQSLRAAGNSPTPQTARRKLGPNDTIRMAVIGLKGQGGAHVAGFTQLSGTEIVALCDVDSHILNGRADTLEKHTKRKIERYQDIRKLLDEAEIDAVSIATPNHWHSLAAIWAIQHGKDVYVEKPLSHNIWEGRQLVKCARAHGAMVQHGTQGRSSEAIEEGMQKLREGVIGEVYMARALCYKWRPSIGKVDGSQPVPDHIDYDLWCGPAEKKPLMRKNLHYDWHWQWDYGNGDIGNQGVHEMDMARWGLGVKLPRRVQSMGGQFMFEDDKQVPNCQLSVFEYPDENKILQFEVRHWISNKEGDFGQAGSDSIGVLFYGSEGYMAVRYFQYETFLGRDREPGPSAKAGPNQWERFENAMRSRKIEDLGVDVEDGHYSAALCHLANAAYRVNRTLEFNPEKEEVIGDKEAARLLTREYRAPFVVPAIA